MRTARVRAKSEGTEAGPLLRNDITPDRVPSSDLLLKNASVRSIPSSGVGESALG